MEKVLKEYKEAVEENLSAAKAEVNAKDRKRKAHYRLLRASQELRSMTNELLEDTMVI